MIRIEKVGPDAYVNPDGDIVPHDDLLRSDIDRDTPSSILLPVGPDTSPDPRPQPVDPQRQALIDEYERRVDAEADKLNGDYARARAVLAGKGIHDPESQPAHGTPRPVGAQAIHQASLDQKLAKIDTITDPKERIRATNELLAHERAQQELKERDS